MQDQIKLLEKLQRLDLDLIEIQKEIERCSDETKKSENKIIGMKEEIVRETNNLEEKRKERRKKERELEYEIEKEREKKSRAPYIKTNKEYQAILKEIESIRKTINEREDEILMSLEAIDEMEKFINEKQEEYKILVKKWEKEKRDLEDRISQQKGELGKKKELREEILQSLQEDIYKLYEKLKEKRSGLVIVQIKNGSCQGCFMSIPPQLVNDLRKGTELISCPYCQRILIWGTQ